MLTINSLPEIILIHIFEFYLKQITISPESSYYERLVHFKPVISVCKLWRSLSLGHFYGTAICEVHSGIGIKCNIDLAILGNRTHLAKNMWIGLYNNTGYKCSIEFDDILGSLKKSGFSLGTWTNITQLNYCESNALSEVKKHKNDEAALFGYLSKRLPNLDSIICHNLANASGGDMKYDEFFDAPLKDIRKIHLQSGPRRLSMMKNFHCMSHDLAYLCISGGIVVSGGASLLPAKVYAPSLKYLRFYLGPTRFNWDVFYSDKGDGRHIEFASLKELVISFYINDQASDIHDTMFAKTIGKCRFPALTDLTVFSYQSKNSDIASLIYQNCPSLRNLCLRGGSSNELNICETESNWLASLESFTLANESNINTIYSESVIHKLQSNTPLARHVNIRLNTTNSPLITLPSDTNCWQRILTFAIHARVDISTIPMFIRSLKRLKVFVLHLVQTNSIGISSKQLTIIDPVGLLLRTPISTSLQELKLVADDTANIDTSVITYFNEIALSMPSLKKFYVPSKCLNQSAEYIKKIAAHRKFAPELHNLQINFILFDQFEPIDL